MRKSGAKIAKVVVMLGIVLGLAASSQAINPAVWELDNYINAPDTEYFWTSPTFVDPWYMEYEYGYEITQIEIQIFGGWLDITDQLDPNMLSASGSTDEGLPIIFWSDYFEDPTGLVGLSAYLDIYVDENGYGHADITDIDWGTGAVSSIHLVGEVWIQAIPEPATLLSFAGAGLALLRRRFA